MKQFVKQQNPESRGASQPNASAVAGDFNDFKAKVPQTGVTANDGRPVVNGKRKTSTQKRASTQQDGTRAGGQRAFYDTDDGSVGNESEMSGFYVKEEPLSQTVNPNHYPQEDDRNMPESSDGEDGHEDEQESEIILTDEQRRIESEMSRMRAGVRLPYVSGDSYPDTTSGNPSIADLNDMEAIEEEPAPKSQTQRQPPRTSSMQDLNVRTRSHGQEHLSHDPTQTGHANEAKRRIEKSTKQDPAAGFTFSNPREAAKNTQAPVSQTPPSSNVTVPSAMRPTSFSSNVVPYRAEGRPQLTENQRNLPVRDHQDAPKASNKRGKSNAAQQQAASAALQNQHLSSGNVNTSNCDVSDTTALQAQQREQERAAQEQQREQERAVREQQLEQESTSLDYEKAELFKMDYATLKGQSFDSDPNADEFDFHSDQPLPTLNDKLTEAGNFDSKYQAEFFASLPINDWEQAGDWFLSRFGEVLTKLKANRQEKREAAEVFETEIEKRHAAVSKKRKQTEEELAGMKQSGVKVLERTPKKTKTT